MNDSSNWSAEISFPSRRVMFQALEPNIEDDKFSITFEGETPVKELPVSVGISWKNTKLVCVDELKFDKHSVIIETHSKKTSNQKSNGRVYVNERGGEIVFEANLTELKAVCDSRTLLKMK